MDNRRDVDVRRRPNADSRRTIVDAVLITDAVLVADYSLLANRFRVVNERLIQ